MHPVTDALVARLRDEDRHRAAAAHRPGDRLPRGARPVRRTSQLRASAGQALVRLGARLEGRAPRAASPC